MTQRHHKPKQRRVTGRTRILRGAPYIGSRLNLPPRGANRHQADTDLIWHISCCLTKYYSHKREAPPIHKDV